MSQILIKSYNYTQMKKGKRQIVERNIFNEGQDNSTEEKQPNGHLILQEKMQIEEQTSDQQFNKSPVQPNPNRFPQQKRYIPPPRVVSSMNQKAEIKKQEVPIPNIEPKITEIPMKTTSQILPTNANQITKISESSQTDEKRKKIELLKQKYLKKNVENKEEPIKNQTPFPTQKSQEAIPIRQKPANPMLHTHSNGSNMINILEKKINQSVKMQVPVPQKKEIPISDPFYIRDDHFLNKINQIQVEDNNVNHEKDLDEEHIANTNEFSDSGQLNSNEFKQQNHINFQEISRFYLKNPQKVLKELHPSYSELTQIKSTQIIVTSKNKNFNPLFSKVIEQFIFKSQSPLNQSQKRILQEVGLELFYSNGNNLTDLFLVCLIKLGRPYFEKYKNALFQKIDVYIIIILRYKNLFLQDQISAFIDFILQNGEINQINYFWLMVLSRFHEKLFQDIAVRKFNDQTAVFSILSLCQIHRKDKLYIGLYLKLLTSSIPELKKYNVTEETLKELKEFDIPEQYYQIAKQLKLSLIAIISNEGPKSEFVKTKEEESSKDGLFKYFNKAIDKIKNTTANIVEKQKEKEKATTQQDKIEYDPILKRYLINGKIPDDQSNPNKSIQNTEENESAKVPLPPPPKKIVTGSVPPPPPSKKRAVINRYV